MNFSVAIDFTASNGDPRDKNSLHYRSPQGGDNQYSIAIKSVGEIIQDYDTDKKFPALGFGAKIPPHNQLSNNFHLSMRPDMPHCDGVHGILQAYFGALNQVQLYGPTNFAPVILHMNRVAQQHQDGRQYFVLLIITDGIITDMEDTKQAIISASLLPVSIIIIGVGNENFKAMEILDADNGVLRAQGKSAVRDIVQFVELRRFVSKGGQWSKERLAQCVCAEVPNQVTAWMNLRGVKPPRG